MSDWTRQAFFNPDHYLLKVRTVYGDTYYINKEQLAHNRKLGLHFVQIFKKDGRPLRVQHNPKEFQTLHIENIQEG